MSLSLRRRHHNYLTRRQVFSLVIGAMVSRSLLTNPALATALEQGEADKIARTISMARATIRQGVSGRRVVADVDALLTYMMANFDTGETTADELEMLVSYPDQLGLHGDLLIQRELERLAERLVPFAVLRELLQTHHLHVTPRGSAAFAAFTAGYRNALRPRR